MPRALKLLSCWFILAVLASGAPASGVTPDRPTWARISEMYGKLPLAFEANQGQVDNRVEFLCRGQATTLFLTRSEAVLSLRGGGKAAAVVRMRLMGGNRDPRLVGVDPQPTKSNYFLGSDPRRWRTGVANYGSVRYEEVYPGVDLVYRGNPRQLEYDFVVAPGGDPGKIRLAFRGAESIRLGAEGELILHTPQGDLVQPAPVVYQEVAGTRRPIESRYVLARRKVGFAVGRYDRARPLIIDPTLIYSTFLGGVWNEGAHSIAVDAAGNAYVLGATGSPDFPGINFRSLQSVYAGADLFISKINAAGTAVFSTFLGSFGADFGSAISLDEAGNVYVTGTTDGPLFPGVGELSIQKVYGGGVRDAFVTKINAAGSEIVYSTFLGGDDSDLGLGIAADESGNAYVTGRTSSAGFPGTSGSFIQPALGGLDNAFVTKINPGGTAIVYSTYLGFSGSEGTAIAVDRGGNAYVTGNASFGNFPGVTAFSIQPTHGRGSFDAFVTKIDSAGTAIVYSTFLGGSGDDGGLAIAVDGPGNVYVTGFTESTNFRGVGDSSIQPVHGGSRDAFVTKINAAGNAIVYSTFLGGGGGDETLGIALDGAGNAYVAGRTDSKSFPGINGNSIESTYGGGELDAFATKIDAAGNAIVYSTYLGGSGLDQAFGIAVDRTGQAYVTGETSSAFFTGVDVHSLQSVPGIGTFGKRDAFVTKISGTPLPPPSGTCAADATTLCIDDKSGDRRFQVRVRYQTTQGGGLSGEGHAIPLASLGVARGGLFWFFGADNPEMLIKVLNACSANHKFWVYYSAATNVGLNVTVLDTTTGRSKSYENADLTPALPVQDSAAFDCAPGDAAAASPERIALPAAAATCAPDDTTLCIGGRFKVQVAYQTSQGGGLAGNGHAIPLASLGVDRGGLFWFFGADNPEMMIKVLDACSLNHKFWVYYSAGTNVGLTVTVTDVQTESSVVYRNTDLTPALPVQDAAALPCP